MAAIATFALKAGVWFRRGRLLIVSPDSLGTACPLSGRNSTYRPVQILEASSQQEREAEKASLLDATLVEHAIERRLRKQISAGDGLIIVRDPDLSAVHTMPSATQWKITCDWSGIVITFVFGGGDDSNSVVVPITDVSLSQEQCANLGPIVGRKLLELSSKPNQG